MSNMTGPTEEVSDPASPVYGAAHPSVDLLTDHRAVVISQRPVIGLSSWLADVITRVSGTPLVPTLVSPDTTRITLPVRMLATEGLLQWAVRTETGSFYDGLLGYPMSFDGADFVAGAGRSDSFDETAGPQSWQLIVSLTIEHRATVQVQLGGAVEILTRELTGSPPAGWGVHEPVSEPWNRAELTTLVRRRMPRETQIVATGADTSMIATLRTSRTERGLEESVLCLIDAGSLDRPISEVSAAISRALRVVAEHETVGFAVAYLRPGRRDLTESAHVRAQPVPLAIVVGPRAVRSIGRTRFFRPSLPVPIDVGRPRVPGLLIALGAGASPPWQQLADLVTELGADRVRAAAPGLAALTGADDLAVVKTVGTAT